MLVFWEVAYVPQRTPRPDPWDAGICSREGGTRPRRWDLRADVDKGEWVGSRVWHAQSKLRVHRGGGVPEQGPQLLSVSTVWAGCQEMVLEKEPLSRPTCGGWAS